MILLFLIVIRFIFTHFIVVPTAGTCIKDALTRRSRLGYVYRMLCCICSKTTIFALTQRVRPAFRREIYYYHRIVVYYDAGILPHYQKQIVRKNLKKKKDTDTHDECLSFSRKEDCEYGYCCTTYTGNDTGIFGTIIILCCSISAVNTNF